MQLPYFLRHRFPPSENELRRSRRETQYTFYSLQKLVFQGEGTRGEGNKVAALEAKFFLIPRELV